MAGSTGLEPATSGLTERFRISGISRHRTSSAAIRALTRTPDLVTWLVKTCGVRWVWQSLDKVTNHLFEPGRAGSEGRSGPAPRLPVGDFDGAAWPAPPFSEVSVRPPGRDCTGDSGVDAQDSSSPEPAPEADDEPEQEGDGEQDNGDS